MSRQFEVRSARDMDHAAEEVRRASEKIAPYQYTWMIQWAIEKCQENIKKQELDLVLHEHFKREVDTTRSQEWINKYQNIHEFLQWLRAFAVHQQAESGAPDILAALTKQKRPAKRK